VQFNLSLGFVVAADAELRQAYYSSPGSGKCSTDAPYTVKNTNRSRCAVECLHLANCADFNYKNDLKECAVYKHKPLFYESITDCQGFKASYMLLSC